MPEGEGRLAMLPRSAIALVGLILIGAAWPVGFVAIAISGGGHSNPFQGSAAEAVFGTTMVAIPLLMVAVGLACLAAVTRRRLRIAGMLALAIPLDLIGAVAALWVMNRPEPPVAYPVSPEPRVIGPARMVATGNPTVVAVACSATTGECTSRSETIGNAASPAKP